MPGIIDLTGTDTNIFQSNYNFNYHGLWNCIEKNAQAFLYTHLPFRLKNILNNGMKCS